MASGLAAVAFSGAAQESNVELALELANPLASLVSVPIKVNWDTGIGPAGADRTTLIVQPVVPFALNREWNLVTRTIVPVIHAQSPVAGGSSTSGLGDITQSFFLSPNAPAGGWIWGAGVVGLYPTATNAALGAKKWGLGPTLLGLRQSGGLTYGALLNHIWSVAGDSTRPDLSITFIQPFMSYTTATATGFSINAETTYDWQANQWLAPVNLGVSQLLKLGQQPVSFVFNLRKFVEAPDGGPSWGLSLQVTLLFPK